MCDFKGGNQKRVKVPKYDKKGLVKSVGQHEHHVSQIMKLSEGFCFQCGITQAGNVVLCYTVM